MLQSSVEKSKRVEELRSQGKTVKEACKSVGMHVSLYYDWRKLQSNKQTSQNNAKTVVTANTKAATRTAPKTSTTTAAKTTNANLGWNGRVGLVIGTPSDISQVITQLSTQKH